MLFANFAEAVAEGRGKAQAERSAARKEELKAKLYIDEPKDDLDPVSAQELVPGDIVLVEAGDIIPSDGEVIEGVASVNEAAITGESAPVIRESGGDRSAVTGGTLVISDWIKVRITAAPGLDLPRPHDRAGRGRASARRRRTRSPSTSCSPA